MMLGVGLGDIFMYEFCILSNAFLMPGGGWGRDVGNGLSCWGKGVASRERGRHTK